MNFNPLGAGQITPFNAIKALPAPTPVAKKAATVPTEDTTAAASDHVSISSSATTAAPAPTETPAPKQEKAKEHASLSLRQEPEQDNGYFFAGSTPGGKPQLNLPQGGENKKIDLRLAPTGGGSSLTGMSMSGEMHLSDHIDMSVRMKFKADGSTGGSAGIRYTF